MQILLLNLDIETLNLNTNDLYVFVSQSGETADTYAALEKCKKNKFKNMWNSKCC